MTATPFGLLDTSAVILLPRLAPSAVLPEDGAIAALTLAELMVGAVVPKDPPTIRRRAAEAEFARSNFQIIPFDVAAATAYPSVVKSLRAAGRKSASRTTDALIAAVAMAHGLPLYTCDPADFAGIEGLKVVAVPHPDRN